jgi:hypothetical protein
MDCTVVAMFAEVPPRHRSAGIPCAGEGPDTRAGLSHVGHRTRGGAATHGGRGGTTWQSKQARGSRSDNMVTGAWSSGALQCEQDGESCTSSGAHAQGRPPLQRGRRADWPALGSKCPVDIARGAGCHTTSRQGVPAGRRHEAHADPPRPTAGADVAKCSTDSAQVCTHSLHHGQRH